MNRAKYTAAVLLIFIRDTAVEPDIPKRKQIEVDAAVKNLGIDPSELSFDDKQQSFKDLAEMRVLHNDGERWFLAPELADWMRLPKDALDQGNHGPQSKSGDNEPTESNPAGSAADDDPSPSDGE